MARREADDRERASRLRRSRSATLAYGRHHQLVTAACAPIGLVTLAEAEFLRHADTHLLQPPAVARDRDAVTREAGIGFDERLLDLIRRDRERLRELDIGLGDLHLRTRLAHGIEIGARVQPRAGAM